MDKMIYHLFAKKYTYYGPFKQPTRVTVTRYNGDGFERQDFPSPCGDIKHLVKEGFINWVNISGLGDSGFIMEQLADLGFHQVDAKAVITPCHASKFNTRNDRLLIVLRSCRFGEKQEVVTEHMAIIARGNLVLTFRELDEPAGSPVVDAIRDDVLGVRSSDYMTLIALLLNNVFAQTMETAMRIEDTLEKLDDILLDASHNRLNVAKRIEESRHANLILQKNNVILFKEFQEFIARNEQVNADDDLGLIYDELSDQLEYIVLTSVNCRELLASMRDLYTSNNELKTNSVMKRLTIVATMFIPLTFLTGLWGMNFKYMPELDWRIGYPLALVAISMSAFFTWRYMKRHNWF